MSTAASRPNVQSPVSGPGAATMVILVVVGGALSGILASPIPILACLVIGLYLMFAIKIANQWERVAQLRLGKYLGLRGPGLFFIVPVIDSLSKYVDQRYGSPTSGPSRR